MSPDPALLGSRPTLSQVLRYLGMSKATFYRHYRPAPVSGEITSDEAEIIWDYFTRRLDIREVVKAGRPTLTFDGQAIIALGDALRVRADGPLAVTRSSRAARFGKCAEKGFGSRVLKDGAPRPSRNTTAACIGPVECQR